jgi:nifR3 family TIM-barrel protein
MAGSFWHRLKRPFFVLAPMADVTDTVFRRVIAAHGRPDVMFTEFVSADGLQSAGRPAVIRDLLYTEGERPLVAQIFSARPENIFKTVELVKELGFDGVDINMGCPEKNVVKQGACSALIKNPELAREVVLAAREAAEAGEKKIPVSVKTRLGFNQDILEEWLPALLETKPAVITLHARTRKEMSKVPARWHRIRDAVEMAKGSGTLIVGNGDVTDLEDARRKAEETGADGVMLGRAVFGNPWLFNREGKVPTLEEKLRAMVEHTRLFKETWGETKNFDLMKKHYKAYVSGFSDAKALRVRLMECQNAEEVARQVEDFLRPTGSE